MKKRKKVAQKIKNEQPQNKMSSLKIIKWLGIFVCVIFVYHTYTNWNKLLEKLDDKPIGSFALMGKPLFTTSADIRNAILKMGDVKGFFAQDINPIREQIEQMPWIKSAVVRKVWPDRLSVWLIEHFPIAVWNDNEFLSSDGSIFRLPPDKLPNIENFPQLFGPNYRRLEVMSAWNAIAKDLKSRNMILKSVAIDERGSWQIVLDNNITLKLGRGEWHDKIDRFVTIYPEIVVPENKRLSYIDLRYNVGAAVGFVDN